MRLADRARPNFNRSKFNQPGQSKIIAALSPATALVMLLALTGGVRADTIVIEASKDNTLYQSTGFPISNGLGTYIFAGKTNSGEIRRAVVRFDIAANIPAGSVINSASLSMRMSRTIVGSMPVSVRPVLASWGEGASVATGGQGGGAAAEPGDVTWEHRFYDGTLWATPGGEFGGTPSATTNVGGVGLYNWSSAQLAADVQNWLDNPANNHGWIVIGNEAATPSAKRFDSRHVTTASNRPRLTINFTPTGAAGACCVSGGGCVLNTATQCADLGGSHAGNGVSCAAAACPPPTGGCCQPVTACAALTEAACLTVGGIYLGNGAPCTPNQCPVQLEPFVDALPIPPVAQPVSGVPGGAATYDMFVTQQMQQLHQDLPPTKVWGFNGSFPGPTIETKTDLPVTVRWVNNLRDAQGDLLTQHALPVDPCPHGADMFGNPPHVIPHLHGGHVPASVDGYPENAFPPGEEVTYVYPNQQTPATLWYHDHALGITRLNVMMGLAGFYLVRDDFESLLLNLPGGAYEVPLVLQDRSFNPDGSLAYPAMWDEHFFGDFILVNGKVWPFMQVRRGKYRFRVLNGSNSRTYTLALSNGATFWQIGTDGGLLPAPVTRSSVTLSPGERADIVIDFGVYAASTQITLLNSAPAPYPGTPGEGVVPNVMKFIVQSLVGDVDALPASLRPVAPIPESESVQQRDFDLRKLTEACSGSAWFIDGLMWHDITEEPLLGTTEVWAFVNKSGMSHPMHMHLVQFQVLDRQPFVLNGDEIEVTGSRVPPPANEAGWKDTVRADPFEITRVIARFEDYTGNYAYHCHILEHEDHQMMRQFRVTCLKGDTNLDGQVDGRDIEGFVDAVIAGGPAGTGPFCAADMDDGGTLDAADDLAAFVDCLVDGTCP